MNMFHYTFFHYYHFIIIIINMIVIPIKTYFFKGMMQCEYMSLHKSKIQMYVVRSRITS